MKLLLLTGTNPAKVKTWVCQETSVIGSLLPPADLCTIAAYVDQHGHSAMIEDLRLARDWPTLLRRRIETYRPDVVGMNLVTTSYLEDVAALQQVRQMGPELRLACFGTHAESCRRETFADGVDRILVGDPEAAMLGLLEGRDEGVATPERLDPPPALLASPDDVPFYGPRFIDLTRYHAAHHAGARRFMPLIASRGCPYRCTYCLYPTLFGGKARYRSPASMVDELVYLSTEHQITSVNYLDATFNLHRQRLLDFCARLEAQKLPLRYACNARCDLLDEPTAQALAGSGCSRIYLGVEDPEQFDKTRKKLSFEPVRDAFRLARANDIETVAFLMLFADGAASEQQYYERMRGVIDTLDPDALQINISIPFPGTADFARQRDQLNLDWSLFDPGGDRLPYDSPIDLPAVKRRLYRYFIRTNPRKVLRVVRQMPLPRLLALGRQFVSQLI